LNLRNNLNEKDNTLLNMGFTVCCSINHEGSTKLYEQTLTSLKAKLLLTKQQVLCTDFIEMRYLCT
ncbi:hypothetical protein KZ403_11450, partial [Glaesserella parasuis]|nr:hypothetical protein [Glaesserella parasuis]